MWDIFFISYQETNAELNWRRLLSYHKDAKRLHGIKGINNVHILANQLSETEYFWVIDGDNYLIKELEYNNPNTDLIIFHTIDPLNELPFTLGSAKLWRKDSFINHDMDKGDFTLFSTINSRLDTEIFTINNYNFTAYETWKTSFRHCVKLISPILSSIRTKDNLDMYLNRWKNTKDSPKLHSNWAYNGYIDAQRFVKDSNNDMKILGLINDYQWLDEHFQTIYQSLILSEPNL